MITYLCHTSMIWYDISMRTQVASWFFNDIKTLFGKIPRKITQNILQHIKSFTKTFYYKSNESSKRPSYLFSARYKREGTFEKNSQMLDKNLPIHYWWHANNPTKNTQRRNKKKQLFVSSHRLLQLPKILFLEENPSCI